MFRNAMRKRESEVDIGLVSADILITKEDKKNCRKIKQYVYQIAGRNLRDANEESSVVKEGEQICR